MSKCAAVIRELVLPVGMALLLAFMFRPVYIKDGSVDYFLMWILIGFPFGIRRMWLWLIPRNYSLAGTVGVFALNIIVSGIIGGVALVLQVIKGTVNLIKCFTK